MGELVFCANCGLRSVISAPFCTNCGASLHLDDERGSLAALAAKPRADREAQAQVHAQSRIAARTQPQVNSISHRMPKKSAFTGLKSIFLSA